MDKSLLLFFNCSQSYFYLILVTYFYSASSIYIMQLTVFKKSFLLKLIMLLTKNILQKMLKVEPK